MTIDLSSLITVLLELQPRVYVPWKKNERERQNPRVRVPNVNLVPMSTQGARGVDKNASFGEHLFNSTLRYKNIRSEEIVRQTEDGGMEITWTPSASTAIDDNSSKKRKSKDSKRRGGESFGAGMERGGTDEVEIKETEKKGRTQRRRGIRSGSKNFFRNLGT